MGHGPLGREPVERCPLVVGISDGEALGRRDLQRTRNPGLVTVYGTRVSS